MRKGRDVVTGDGKKAKRKEMILSGTEKRDRQEDVRKRIDGVALKGKKRET